MGRILSRAVPAAALIAAMAVSGVPTAAAAPTRPDADPAPAATTVDLEFGSYNVCMVSCRKGRFSWEKRRSRVIRSIAAAEPAVLGVQEATMEYTRDGAPQYLDLAFRLEGEGYSLANPDPEDVELECSRGSHLFYRQGVVEPAVISSSLGEFSSGLESLQARTSSAAWGRIGDRCFAWAYLRHVPTGGVFLAVSAHLVVEKNRTGELVRRSSARALASWAEVQNSRLGLDGLPVVLMADLNSYRSRQRRGAQFELFRSGYRDSYSAVKRVNHRYTTSNHVGRSDGWPSRPIRMKRNPARIDYVMVRNGVMPLRYEVFLRLRRNGTFHPAYRGSDHNMVLGTWRLPVVVW